MKSILSILREIIFARNNFWKKKLKSVGSHCGTFAGKVDASKRGDYNSQTVIIPLVEAYNSCVE